MTDYDRQILRIAIPSIVSNITVPLLGLVDVAITGHLGSPAYIGAIAVGSMIFNLIYWLFAFLRMGTSGMTAQALGRRDMGEVRAMLHRSVTVALGLALLFIIGQRLICSLGLTLINPGYDVRPFVLTYFNICIYGAPAVMALYSMNGWLVGMQNTRLPMAVSITQNIINILASLFFVFVAGMKIEGVALGTLVAQWCGAAMEMLLIRHFYRRLFTRRRETTRMRWTDYSVFFNVNRDIFIRTLLLVGVNVSFTAAGARQGTVILSVNALLIQYFLLFSYFTDGFANAGEALCGRFLGARDGMALEDVVKRLFRWGIIIAALFTAVYTLGGASLLDLLTSETAVAGVARIYLPWVILVPATGIAAFIFDGVFIGITATKGMLLSCLGAALLFFAVMGSSARALGNHALWLSFIVFLAARGAIQAFIYRYYYINTIRKKSSDNLKKIKQ